MHQQSALALIGGPTLKIQLQIQLADHGDRAADVAMWLTDHYPHLNAHTWAQPGLCVALDVPRVDLDGIAGWEGRFHEATGPIDLAFEVLSQCFAALRVPDRRVLSVHMTG